MGKEWRKIQKKGKPRQKWAQNGEKWIKGAENIAKSEKPGKNRENMGNE